MDSLVCKEVVARIYHLEFSSQHELASSFLRFQEHYESPEFRGKAFSLDEYVEWYIAHSPGGRETGKFTYYDDWCGFNIPSYVLEPFYEGEFNPLSDAECRILDLFRDLRGERFYIIGTGRGLDPDTLEHEIAHGLFYTCDGYRQEVLDALGQLGQEDMCLIMDELGSTCGYHPSVFDDEAHAYILTETGRIAALGVEKYSLESVHTRLIRLYEEYACPSGPAQDGESL
ncbi:ABC transporter ATP-binding protein [Candidatus Woesearchaeota archaeon]|nr:ABC transporter ATP-binding protein [Candidatus Woesearchaeota archaeon]